MGPKKPHTSDEKIVPFCSRVLVGNWYEAAKLEEHKLNSFLTKMKSGQLMLARFRKMNENINEPAVLTKAVNTINYGSTVCLRAPHVPSTHPPREDKRGLLLGGRITCDEIVNSQDLEDGCSVALLTDPIPRKRSAFILASPDYCNRDDEHLKYNEEFMLLLASSAQRKKPLYIRYDPNPIPGLNSIFPLYLSKHPVSNARWRILPVQKPDITRFEQEGLPIQVNQDIVVNHCSTNVNLGVNIGQWALGFNGSLCAPLMKTCLDIFGRELPNNIWQIYVPIDDEPEDKERKEGKTEAEK